MYFWDRDSDCHYTLCRNILKCLVCLPNLRSLTFQGELDFLSYVFTNYFFGEPKTQKYFPDLPFLETFSWKVRFNYQYESSWITRMLKTYARNTPNLRKLEVAENNWYKTDHKFGDLTELHLLLDTDHDTGLEEVEHVFRELKNLRKFTLSQTPPPSERLANFQRHEINITELLLNLADHQIENLTLENLRLIEKPVEQDIKFVSSVTSLYFEDNPELSYEFLRWLPNLKCLTILMKYDPESSDLYPCQVLDSAKTENWLAKNLRYMCLQAYYTDLLIPKDFSIWKAFPKLETLTASVVIVGSENGFREGAVLDAQFFREYGNKAFYANRPVGFDDDDDESEEEQPDNMEETNAENL